MNDAPALECFAETGLSDSRLALTSRLATTLDRPIVASVRQWPDYLDVGDGTQIQFRV